MTKVVNIKYEQCDVKIMRPTMWGNIFSHVSGSTADIAVGTRLESIECYRDWLLGKDFIDFKQNERKKILSNLYKLKNRSLGCICPSKLCHGNVLAQLADQDINEKNIEDAKIVLD